MRRTLSILLLVAFCAVFLVSGYFLVDYIGQSVHAQKTYDELNSLRHPTGTQGQQGQTTPPSGPASTDGSDPTGETNAPTEPTIPDELISIEDPETGKDMTIWASLAELYRLNPDIIGYITFDALKNPYPLMQRPDSKDYYLHTDFYGSYSNAGCLYLKEDCDLEKSDNVTIYGHNMKDGSMFAGLMNFTDKEYWQYHQTFTIETLTNKYQYQIIAVFKTSGYSSQGGYSYHKFVNASSEEAFNSFVADVKQMAMYDTGLTAEYGDHLICLSTCEYTLNNGRLVVVAKRLPNETEDVPAA